jgi:hypothetical protein
MEEVKFPNAAETVGDILSSFPCLLQAEGIGENQTSILTGMLKLYPIRRRTAFMAGKAF